MADIFDKNAPKKPTNLSINSELLKMAREHGINLSATLEEALADRLTSARQQQWLTDNTQSIAAYNEHIEKHGIFSDGQRSF